ncbi:Lrp/AsnC family transcriptional regulator [Actinomadura gamaensis]|uniref:Lrp/AsnC family transcriptional regulator n=1 Tax=Actinomadura gamaensis TaxID=1763541 RepID=A0ABV9U843_9ACTN
MDSVMLDEVDRGLVHALRIDGRVPFVRIAEVLGVSENTVARRYRKLRSTGTLRVAGTVNGASLGYTPWTIRLRCTPDAAAGIADALAARPDVSYVYLLSGGTEISCNTQTGTPGERDALLLERLPRTRRVLGVSAHMLLGSPKLPKDWTGLDVLTPAQVTALHPPPVQPAAPEPAGAVRPSNRPVPDAADRVALDAADRAMLDVLALDGRASYAELAAATGWSEATARRRASQLRDAGVLSYQLDLAYERVGFRAEARLWMSVRPSRLKDVAEALAAHPESSFVAMTTGPTNLVAAVLCRDAADLARYLTERVASLEDVHEVESAPVIRTLKRAGAPLPL